MGPRLLSRGVAAEVGTSAARMPRFNGAAASQPRSPPELPLPKSSQVTLQWGRGFSAAESP